MRSGSNAEPPHARFQIAPDLPTPVRKDVPGHGLGPFEPSLRCQQEQRQGFAVPLLLVQPHAAAPDAVRLNDDRLRWGRTLLQAVRDNDDLLDVQGRGARNALLDRRRRSTRAQCQASGQQPDPNAARQKQARRLTGSR